MAEAIVLVVLGLLILGGAAFAIFIVGAIFTYWTDDSE